MTPLLVAAGAVVALGAGVAVGAREPRAAAGGALVVLVLSPFLADPLPDTVVLAYRIVAGVLAAYLLAVASRRADPDVGSPLGLPAGLVTAAAAFAAGLGATAVGLPTFGPTAALAAGLACLAAGVPPLLRTDDAFRLGSAVVVLVAGGLLVLSALAGTLVALDALVAGGALVAVAVAVVALGQSARDVEHDASGPRRPVGASAARGAPLAPAGLPVDPDEGAAPVSRR